MEIPAASRAGVPRARTPVRRRGAGPPAHFVRLRNGRLAAVIEHLAEHEIVDRRPAPIRFFDPLTVDVPSHSLVPCPDFYPRITSGSGGAMFSRTPPRGAAFFAV